MEQMMLVNNPLFAAFTAAPSTASGQMSPVQGTDSASVFANLLDVVSDMSLADAQSEDFSQFVDSEAKNLLEDPKKSFNESLSQLSPLLVNVGLNQVAAHVSQDVGHLNEGISPKIGASETLSQGDWLLKTESLQQTANMHMLAEKNASQAKPDTASVQAWALALASDDVKSVSIDDPKAVKVADAPSAMSFWKEDVLSKSEPVDSTKSRSMGDVVTQIDKKSEPSKNFEAISADKEVLKIKSRVSAPKEEKVQNGSDFLLSDANALHSAAQHASTKGPEKAGLVAVSGRLTLGEVGDNRVSPQSASFVADKIQSLKQQGGGRIRVELNPQELGSVEIHVSVKRGGLMDVQVFAERPETLKMFENSKADLVAKLGERGSAQVDMRPMLKDMAGAGASVAPRSVESSAMGQMSSDQILQLRNTSDVMAPLSSSMNDVKSMSSNSKMSQERSFDGGESSSRDSDARQFSFNRDEKRDRAHDQWREHMSERNIA